MSAQNPCHQTTLQPVFEQWASKQNTKELIQAELDITRTLLDIGYSKLAAADLHGASRAVRNAEAALQTVPDLFSLAIRHEHPGLRIEFLDLQQRLTDLRERIPHRSEFAAS